MLRQVSNQVRSYKPSLVLEPLSHSGVPEAVRLPAIDRCRRRMTAVLAAALRALLQPCYRPHNSLDIMLRQHQDAPMRTTIDLPDDLHRIVTSLATHTRSSLSHTAADLIRRGLALPARDAEAPAFTTHSVTGLPVLHSPRPITPEDVKALDDE